MAIIITRSKASYDLLYAMEALSREYYDAETGVPPYEFNAKMFVALEDAKSLVIVTAWDGAKLVGYNYAMMMTHPHHMRWKLAYCGIATAKAYRGQGIGRHMYEAIEPLLKLNGVSRVIYCERVKLGADPLYPKLGFELEERTYKKDL